MTIDPADHVRLAEKIARRHGCGVPDPVAVREVAIETLVRAARAFDSSRGSWPAYASASISNAVRGEVARQLAEARAESLTDLDEDGEERERGDIPRAELVESGRLRFDELFAALDLLPPREARLLRLRYGIDGEERTLEEVGRELGISRERTRQLERSALEKLEQALATRHAPNIVKRGTK